MIEIKEKAWVEAWENGFKIDDEFFSVGHGASVDNREKGRAMGWGGE